ncbi:hypothetical protein [Furfurilactobacillus curtus]|uniref:Uncharacterized protein n=1 Tax=Furfurilactobacillus curtus TaxID=1746200 RepID=A0ABQ5JNF4_9LACO
MDQGKLIENVLTFVLLRTKAGDVGIMLNVLDEQVVVARQAQNIALLVELQAIPLTLIRPEYVTEIATIKHYFKLHPLLTVPMVCTNSDVLAPSY